jgi:transcriptional regulator with XRE-family HTH domain
MVSESRPARRELARWLKGVGRTQVKLADAVGVSQQTISGLLSGRPLSEDLAKLIEAATGISWLGWFTRRERESRQKRMDRAAAFRSATQ